MCLDCLWRVRKRFRAESFSNIEADGEGSKIFGSDEGVGGLFSLRIVDVSVCRRSWASCGIDVSCQFQASVDVSSDNLQPS